jgi:hypothetical protein
MAAAHVAGAGSLPVSTSTCGRRGSPDRPDSTAAASSSTIAAAADHAFLLTGNTLLAWTTRTPAAAATRSRSSRKAGSASTARIPWALGVVIAPPCRDGDRQRQSHRRICGQHPRCGQPAGDGPAKNRPPQKGRPPPGGEEARVVVYQPRGVGLIHPRLGRVILTIHMTV